MVMGIELWISFRHELVRNPVVASVRTVRNHILCSFKLNSDGLRIRPGTYFFVRSQN